MCDEYYGENVLHIAIVNEDPAMVKFLLDAGSNIHERCCGTFMSPEDQKGTRYDIIEQEPVCVNPFTNYEGYVYWGEYPLSFAACLCQEECYRLVLAKHADPDYQDINGNTVLHMLVIHEKLTTFDMGYETGADLNIKNLLNLTPLTLAAKLARVEMFFHIINIEREIYWQLGSITCAAYPLEQLDTIDIKTGNISKDSTLNLVVFGVRTFDFSSTQSATSNCRTKTSTWISLKAFSSIFSRQNGKRSSRRNSTGNFIFSQFTFSFHFLLLACDQKRSAAIMTTTTWKRLEIAREKSTQTTRQMHLLSLSSCTI